MDRVLIYPGQVPLETDLLNTNRNALIALGRFAADVLGSTTVAAGLAVTPTSPATMAVKVGAGAIYSMQSVDGTAYSSLAADTTNQIMKQGILLASDNLQLTLTAPGTVGTSVIYLIQGTYTESDTNNVVLPYYNASNPAVPYSGPANSGASSATTRKGGLTINAKAGTASASPVAPTADAGYIPLYTVTVAYGASSVTAGNIATASGAPFITPISSGASYLALAGGTMAGAVALYQGSTINDGAGNNYAVGYRDIPQNSQSTSYTLVAADAGKHIYHPSADTTARTWTIPANASVAFPIGTAITFVNDTSAGSITIAITTDTLVMAPSGSTGSRTLAANGVATAIKVTATRWMISGSGLS